MSAVISFKCPDDLLDRLPAAGNGRSAFIVDAIQAKLSKPTPSEWTPTTARGRRLAAILARGKAERGPEVSIEAVDEELAARRGRHF